MTEPLTRAEKAWMRKVEKLLKNPPSDRLGLYTIGDPNLSVYDSHKDGEIDESMRCHETWDFCTAVADCDAELGFIRSAVPIHSTAG